MGRLQKYRPELHLPASEISSEKYPTKCSRSLIRGVKSLPLNTEHLFAVVKTLKLKRVWEGWVVFLKQHIHISAHFHILEPVTVSFSATCMVHQEETAGVMPKFWVCMAISLSSLSIYSLYISNTLKWGEAPLPQFL